MRLRRATICLLLAGFVGVLLANRVSAQTSLNYTINPTSGPAGQTVSFQGNGCPPDEDPNRSDGRFQVYAAVGAGVNTGGFIGLGSFNSKPDHSFSGAATIASDAEPGVHQTLVTCGDLNKLGPTFTVTAPTTTTVATTPVLTAPTSTTTPVLTAPTAAPTTTTVVSATPTSVAKASVAQPVSQRLAVTGSPMTKTLLLAFTAMAFGLMCFFITRRDRFDRIRHNMRAAFINHGKT